MPRLLRHHPCGLLLAAQLLGICLYPFFEGYGDEVAQLLLSLFGLVVLAAAIAVVRATRLTTWLAVVIGVPTVVLTIVDVLTRGLQPWHSISDVAHIAFYGYTFVGLLLYMFDDDVVTTDEVLAIGATFTVGVWLFAYAYDLLQSIVPGSFTAAVNPDAQRTWLELLFLSCTTMTSTGLSDIVPVKPHARSLVMLQQIAGMLYVAIVVARIVGLTLRRKQATR